MHLWFGDSASRVKQVVSPQSRAYTKALGDSLESQEPSCEKDLEKFQKYGFLIFLTQFVNLFMSGISSYEFYSEWFATPLMTYSWVDLPVAKNT